MLWNNNLNKYSVELQSTARNLTWTYNQAQNRYESNWFNPQHSDWSVDSANDAAKYRLYFTVSSDMWKIDVSSGSVTVYPKSNYNSQNPNATWAFDSYINVYMEREALNGANLSRISIPIYIDGEQMESGVDEEGEEVGEVPVTNSATFNANGTTSEINSIDITRTSSTIEFNVVKATKMGESDPTVYGGTVTFCTVGMLTASDFEVVLNDNESETTGTWEHKKIQTVRLVSNPSKVFASNGYSYDWYVDPQDPDKGHLDITSPGNFTGTISQTFTGLTPPLTAMVTVDGTNVGSINFDSADFRYPTMGYLTPAEHTVQVSFNQAVNENDIVKTIDVDGSASNDYLFPTTTFGNNTLTFTISEILDSDDVPQLSYNVSVYGHSYKIVLDSPEGIAVRPTDPDKVTIWRTNKQGQSVGVDWNYDMSRGAETVPTNSLQQPGVFSIGYYASRTNTRYTGTQKVIFVPSGNDYVLYNTDAKYNNGEDMAVLVHRKSDNRFWLLATPGVTAQQLSGLSWTISSDSKGGTLTIRGQKKNT